MTVRVQAEPFDFGEEAKLFAKSVDGAGALVTFTGIVRDRPEGGLERMEIEHYPGMTERAISEIRETAMTRWGLANSLIIHRYGSLKVGEPIMMVATAAAHRADAFAAADFLMDYLKSRAPFWKKEFGPGWAEWVDAKDADETALKRW